MASAFVSAPCRPDIASSATIATSAARHEKRLLPATFVPGSDDIIMGRSRDGQKASGNVQLKRLLVAYFKKYNKAKDTLEKTVVSYHVVLSIKEKGGRFVKQRKEDKRWEEISEEQARQKVSLGFRNLRRGRPQHGV